MPCMHKQVSLGNQLKIRLFSSKSFWALYSNDAAGVITLKDS